MLKFGDCLNFLFHSFIDPTVLFYAFFDYVLWGVAIQ